MKKLFFFLITLLPLWSIGQSIIVTGIDGCCVTFSIGLNNSQNGWRFFANCPNPLFCTGSPDQTGSAQPGGTVTIVHCYDSNGFYQAVATQGNTGATTPFTLTECDPCDPLCDNTDLTPKQQELISNVVVDGCCVNFTALLFYSCQTVTLNAVDVCDPSNTVTCEFQASGGSIFNDFSCCFTTPGVYSLSWTVLGSDCMTVANFDAPNDACIEVCQPDCVQIEEDCEYVDFEYCCDGTFTANVLNDNVGIIRIYQKDCNTNSYTGVVIDLCHDWGTSGSCNVGTYPVFLDPNQCWDIGVVGGNCTLSWPIPINIDCFQNGGGEEKHNQTLATINSSKPIMAPNPTQDIITFTKLQGQTLSIEVYSLNGQLMTSGNTGESTSYSMNVETLPQGVYLVQLKDANTQAIVATEKLTIVR